MGKAAQGLTVNAKNGYYIKGPMLDKAALDQDPFFVTIHRTDGFGKANHTKFNQVSEPNPSYVFPGRRGGLMCVATGNKRTGQFYQACNHIGHFFSKGSSTDIDSFLKNLGIASKKAIKKLTNGEWREFYFNTHGKGVSWMHWRFDIKPKYYNTPDCDALEIHRTRDSATRFYNNV